LHDHLAYLDSRKDEKGKFKYLNRHYKFPVMTRQETELFFSPLKCITPTDKQSMEVEYAETPDQKFDGDWEQLIPPASKKSKSGRLQLF